MTPGVVDVQSGSIIQGDLTTSQELAQGPAQLTVSLSENGDKKNRKRNSGDNLYVTVGDVSTVQNTTDKGPATRTQIPIEINPIDPKQNFAFQGPGTLHFTVKDSKGNTFK